MEFEKYEIELIQKCVKTTMLLDKYIDEKLNIISVEETLLLSVLLNKLENKGEKRK